MVVRIFNAKLEEFKKDILKNHVLGKVKAYSYVIEFQKRGMYEVVSVYFLLNSNVNAFNIAGLPHVHMVLWLDPKDAPKKPEDVDRFTCSEIPDPETSPRLHKLVTQNMIHGPCKGIIPSGSTGPPCFKLNDCDKNYPKDLCKHTSFGDHVQPLYRRRSPSQGGHETTVYSKHTKQEHKLDNKWVVPYNR